MKFISEVPREAGRVVSMIQFKGCVLVACEYGVFQLTQGGLKQIKFYNPNNN